MGGKCATCRAVGFDPSKTNPTTPLFIKKVERNIDFKNGNRFPLLRSNILILDIDKRNDNKFFLRYTIESYG